MVLKDIHTPFIRGLGEARSKNFTLTTPPPPHYGFTLQYPSVVSSLITAILLSEAFDPNSEPPHPVPMQFDAIWDTGATNTVIASTVVAKLILKPVGRVLSHTVGGTIETNTYFVNIGLPNGVDVPGLIVSEGTITGSDVLIGMDVISMGDFSISQTDGRTCFSFRIPSIEKIDFVKDIEHYRKTFTVPPGGKPGSN